MDNVRNVERAPEIATLNQNASLDDQLKEESWKAKVNEINVIVDLISMSNLFLCITLIHIFSSTWLIFGSNRWTVHIHSASLERTR